MGVEEFGEEMAGEMAGAVEAGLRRARKAPALKLANEYQGRAAFSMALAAPVGLRSYSSIARVTALLIAGVVLLYAFTGSVLLMALLVVDFFIRGCTRATHSPISLSHAWV